MIPADPNSTAAPQPTAHLADDIGAIHHWSNLTIEYTPARRLPWWRERLVVLCWRLGQALTILGNRIDRLEG